MKLNQMLCLLFILGLMPCLAHAQQGEETQPSTSSESSQESSKDAQSGAVFTLAAGLNIPVGDSISGSLKPGPNVSGDLVAVVDTSAVFKLGIGGISDYSMFFAEFGQKSGFAGVYTLGFLLKPMFRLSDNIYSVTEIGGGYSLAHTVGSSSDYSRNMFGLVAGTGISISKFVFGGKYRMIVDGDFNFNWVNIFVGVIL